MARDTRRLAGRPTHRGLPRALASSCPAMGAEPQARSMAGLVVLFFTSIVCLVVADTLLRREQARTETNFRLARGDCVTAGSSGTHPAQVEGSPGRYRAARRSTSNLRFLEVATARPRSAPEPAQALPVGCQHGPDGRGLRGSDEAVPGRRRPAGSTPPEFRATRPSRRSSR